MLNGTANCESKNKENHKPSPQPLKSLQMWCTAREEARRRKDRQGRRGGGIALRVIEQLPCVGMEEELAESFWVRIIRRVRTGGIIVCYRLPGWEDQADETLCRQIEAASRSQALVLIGTLAGSWTEASDVMLSVFQNCSLPLNAGQSQLLTKSSLLVLSGVIAAKKAVIQRCWRVCK